MESKVTTASMPFGLVKKRGEARSVQPRTSLDQNLTGKVLSTDHL
jgi:hypothetical protein